MFTHQGGVFLVSEGQLVGSKNQRRESEANPLVSTCTKVFPRRVQDLKKNYMVNFKGRYQSNKHQTPNIFSIFLLCWRQDAQGTVGQGHQSEAGE